MSYAAAIVAHERWPRISVAQFVKMGLNYTEQFMKQEEKKQAEGIGLEGSPFLKELIQRSREGDTQAMGTIYEHFNRRIFNLIYRHTNNREIAEDLLQDVFIKVFTNLKSIREEENFIGWLYRVAINSCYSHLRGRKSQLQRTIPLNDVEERISERTSQSGDNIMKKSLDDAIQSLPGKLKTIFLLHDVQGFKHREIAGILGCSVGTSKSQLFKARMKIRDRLESKQVF